MIRLLDDSTISKIAAGEIIENSASIVKELVENSIDAGADDILVEIRGESTNFIKVSDEFAAYGMRVLGNPYKDDKKVISGESGAAPFGSIIKILTDDKYKDERKKLDINSDSNLIFVSTEGDTDAQNYLDIVWDGKYESTGGIE